MLTIFNGEPIYVSRRIKHLQEIYRNNKNITNYNIENMVYMLSNFDTVHVDLPFLSDKLSYWEFLHDILDNIEYGYFKTLPHIWLEYCKGDTTDLTYVQKTNELYKYLEHREIVLTKLNLPTKTTKDKLVILNWFKRDNQECLFLGITHVLIEFYLYLTTAREIRVFP